MKHQTTEALSVSSFHSIPKEEFLTTHELMQLLKIKNRRTIYDLLDQGMPTIRVGKNYRFIKHEVIEFLKRWTESRRVKRSKTGLR